MPLTLIITSFSSHASCIDLSVANLRKTHQTIHEDCSDTNIVREFLIGLWKFLPSFVSQSSRYRKSIEDWIKPPTLFFQNRYLFPLIGYRSMQKTWNSNFYHRGYMHRENPCHGSKLEYISTRGKNKRILSLAIFVSKLVDGLPGNVQ